MRSGSTRTLAGGAAVLLVNDDPSALFVLRTVLADLDAGIVGELRVWLARPRAAPA